ncbi:hypothetical protein BH09PAT1_BH09PAT1_4410 [soil metagenome]
MNKKILVVDDDRDILEPIELLLSLEGYMVQTTTKGEQIYGEVASFKPDLILLDVLMSGSDGRTICKNLKADSAVNAIPIIMMSAHPSAKSDSERCGADDFIAKPFDIPDLLAIIKKYIK